MLSLTTILVKRPARPLPCGGLSGIGRGRAGRMGAGRMERTAWGRLRGRRKSAKASRRRKAVGSGRAVAPRPRSDAASSAMDLAQLDDRVGYFLRRLQIAIFKDFIRTLGSGRCPPRTILGTGPDRRQSGPFAGGDRQGAQYRAGAARPHAARTRTPAMDRASALLRPMAGLIRLFMTAGRQGSDGAHRGLAAQHERQWSSSSARDLRGLLLDRLRKFGKS